MESNNTGMPQGLNFGSLTPMPPRPSEIGFRIIEVDGGFYINNFDPMAGNAVRTDLEGVQTYVAAQIANKFNVTPNAPTQEPQTEINEVGVEAPAEAAA